MTTSTIRGYGQLPRRRSDSAGEPVFTLVQSHAPQPNSADEFFDRDVDADEDDTVTDTPGLRPAWWRRALGYLVFVATLAGAGALLAREEPRNEILRWATFGHADKAQQWIRSLRSAVDPDPGK